MTIAIYLAHLNPVTNAHSEIIKDLTKEDEVVVMPVRFLIDNNEIKIDQIRHLITFLNKSTYSKDLKIVLIDSAENLNYNSSNALLKALE